MRGEAQPPHYMKRRIKKNWRIIVYAIILTFILLVFPLHIMSGNQMSPSIKDGDLLIGLRTKQIYTDDLILYRTEEGMVRVGRVIAKRGQKVDISADGRLMVDDAVIDVNEWNCSDKASIQMPVVLEDDAWFVLNDMRQDLNDSRSYGAVENKNVIGRVFFLLRRRGF